MEKAKYDLEENDKFIAEIKTLITESRERVAVAVNSELTILYWNIGSRINQEVLNNIRADYGQKIMQTLSAQLQVDFGKGFSKRNLHNMVKFNELFPDDTIISELYRKLSWSHIVVLITIDEKIKRDFYARLCMESKWSVRKFQERKNSMLFERTAISKQSDQLILEELNKTHEGKISTKLLLKDPYILDFLELNDRYYEKDLEDAILRELEQFLLELGAGFTFVERQKRIQIDGDNFYLDLLFYNRKLKRLIVLELKLGDFKAEYKGQMELYLRWLDKYEVEKGEAKPLGIILCSGKKQQQIELLELDKSGIHVAEYLTVLPEKKVLEKKLEQALKNARIRNGNIIK